MSSFPDLPRADDGREPFPVTHAQLDAPDGAVIEGGSLGYPGWWQRHDDQWVPVAVPIPEDNHDAQ